MRTQAPPRRARDWTKGNASESSRWPATSPVCGTIRQRCTASASGWRARLIEDVTLTEVTRSLGVRLRGGATRQLTSTPDPLGCEIYKTKDEVAAEIDRLLNDHADGEIAKILSERGYRTRRRGLRHQMHSRDTQWDLCIRRH